MTVHELFKETPGFEIIKKYIPNFEPLFLNLAGKSKEEIEQITDDFLRSALFAMFWRHNSDLFLENIVAIFELDVDEFEKHPLFVYVFSVINKPPEEIMKALQTKNFNNKKKVMSSLEQFIELGRKEGIKKERIKKDITIIKNMVTEKLPIELISKIVELESTFVVDILDCFADFEKVKKGNPLSNKTIQTIKKISSDGLSEELIASLFETDEQTIRAIFKK